MDELILINEAEPTAKEWGFEVVPQLSPSWVLFFLLKHHQGVKSAHKIARSPNLHVPGVVLVVINKKPLRKVQTLTQGLDWKFEQHYTICWL